jgi:hypothetical protein
LPAARSQALGRSVGPLGIGDASYAGGVARTRTSSASFRRLATAACSARAACLLRSFSTAFVQAAVFAADALSLRSICLLRSVSIAFPEALGVATRSCRPADAPCVSFEEVRARVASRQAALPSSHAWFRSADIESARHWTKCGSGSRRQHKFEDQSAVGSQGTNP